MLYKLLSKVLANRLKQILPQIIFNTQSAFVPEQLIIDNILIAYEIIHHLGQKRKEKEKKGSMSIKLDIGKAL